MGGALPRCRAAIVTVGTGTGDPGMVEPDVGPAGGDVAIVTYIAG